MSVINVLGISHVGNLGAGGAADGAIPSNEFLRRYALGNKIAKLSPSRDPFFTIVSKFKRNPTDDPEFKSLEERDIWHRRYAFVSTFTGSSWNAVAITAAGIAGTDFQTPSATVVLKLSTDYDSRGLFHHTNKPVSGIFGSQPGLPTFFFPNQLIKIPVCYAAAAATKPIVANGYVIVRLTAVTVPTSSPWATEVTGTVVALPSWAPGLINTNKVFIGNGKVGADYDSTTGDVLTAMRNLTLPVAENTKRREDRIIVSGSAYAEGSGLPNTTYSDKLSDTFGYTEIFKTDLTMTNTARATVLKHRPNEMLRRWNKTLLQHKRDITLAGLWGVRSKDDVNGFLLRKTGGIVDYISNNGWTFPLTSSTGYDNFLDQLSEFYHPEVAQEGSVLVHVSTAVYNWFSRLQSGFFDNTFSGKQYFSANLSFVGMKKFAGFNILELSTPHGSLHMVKDVNLDGSHVKMLAINYAHVSYRPLVGNGLNRDTTVYMGVKDIEHTGDDARTDLVQTEAGFDFELGETMAMWV